MELINVLFVLIAICDKAIADWQSPLTYCVYGCYSALQFTSDVGIRSLIYCAQIYCADDHIIEGFSAINKTCLFNTGQYLPSRQSVLDPLPPGALDKIPRVSYPAGLKQKFTEPTVPDIAFWRKGLEGERGYYDNINVSLDFSWGLYGFWGLVLFIGFCNRAYRYLTEPLTKDERNRRQLPGSTWFRRFLLLPATVGTHSQQALWGVGTIHLRLESLIIFLYFVLNLVSCFPSYGLFKGDIFSPAISGQIIKYSGDRTGTLAIANFPIIWIFSARNNPFLWLTGWSFSTFNFFHRWVARGTVLLVIVHSAIYTFSYRKTYYEEIKEPYYYAGIIGTVILSHMLGLTIYIFRAKLYDTFLITHVLFALGTLVATYYHLDLFDGRYIWQWTRFLWPPVAMWSVDRILRVTRVAYYATKGTTTYATYDQDAQIIRLDVSSLFPSCSDRRGYYYFVYCPTMLPGWESHPFTLCSWRGDTSGDHLQGSEKANTPGKSTKDGKHTFLIRPYSGFTNRLRKMVMATKSEVESQSCTIPVKVLLEGPYGVRHDLGGYSKILMIAGGSGITPMIPYTHALLSTAEKTGVTVQVVWALPQRAFADTVCAHELAAAVEHENYQLDVYLTSSGDIKSDSGASYSVHSDQPDIEAIVREVRNGCEGSLAVMCCGPPRMADSCRQAVVNVLAESGTGVSFYNETLTW